MCTGHVKHTLCPVNGWYVPSGQGLHRSFSLFQNVPAGHFTIKTKNEKLKWKDNNNKYKHHSQHNKKYLLVSKCQRKKELKIGRIWWFLMADDLMIYFI